ncbi:hypothetical protein AB0L41_11775 [Amycolatopsis mediterranei]
MKTKATAALARHTSGFAQHVEVGVEDGQVLTPAQCRSAEQTAWFAPGVTAVDNQVKLAG